MLIVLEFCLSFTTQHDAAFDYFVSLLGYNSVAFWRLAIPELYAAVPGVRQSMLGIHAKRFGEKYRHLQTHFESRYGSDLIRLNCAKEFIGEPSFAVVGDCWRLKRLRRRHI
uniref:Uncharacterized protein n=1 Tax=Parascaris equorum TaxID=6256 RepID=A0A914R553_PAREQ